MPEFVHLVDDDAVETFGNGITFAKCGARVMTLPERGARVSCPTCLAISRLEDQHQHAETGPRR